jgi:CubicO group peptidase (beta-lactamase class C family)
MFARTSRTSRTSRTFLAPVLSRLLRHAHRRLRRVAWTMGVWRAVTASLALALALAVLGPVATSARASTAAVVDGGAIDDYIAAKMRAPRIPGVALATVLDDQVVYLKGYGQADPAGHPVTPQTPFVIGSISKAFTSLAVMQLVEAGQVTLDAPVQRYLPWFRVADPQAAAQVTVRQLLTMTSGISGNGALATFTWTDDDDAALERHVRYLAQVGLDFPPGRGFEYSNANYTTLGAIVQAVSGQSYEEYVRQHILAPLDMQHTFLSQDDAQAHGLATGYIWWFGIPVATALAYNRGDLPAGFIISSAEDMGHFVIAQMNGGRYQDRSVLSPAGIASMHTEPVPNTYAMGWETAQLNGRTLINHDGGLPSFQASVFFDPETRVGVFVAANALDILDALSSPSASSTLDGITSRGMAASVLALASGQPLPDQGPGLGLLTLIMDLVLLALTGALVVALARLPGRYRELARRGVDRWPDLLRRTGLIAGLHLVWPAVVLYLTLAVPLWRVDVGLGQPDLTAWLEAVALVVALKGALELGLTWRAFRPTRQRLRGQPCGDGPSARRPRHDRPGHRSTPERCLRIAG